MLPRSGQNADLWASPLETHSLTLYALPVMEYFHKHLTWFLQPPCKSETIIIVCEDKNSERCFDLPNGTQLINDKIGKSLKASNHFQSIFKTRFLNTVD